jgi:pantothenate kinase-related protein Tda10
MAYSKNIYPGGSNEPDPLHINIGGTAGTGKSFLIQCITHSLNDILICSKHLGLDNPGWGGIGPSWVPIIPSIA